MEIREHINDRLPNFHGQKSGRFFLVRCYSCGGKGGRVNHQPAVRTGKCAWCGWDIKHVGKKASQNEKTGQSENKQQPTKANRWCA